MEKVNELFGKMWNDFQRFEREREEEAAKKDPKAYRNSQVMERGKSTNYTYFTAPGGRKGEEVRFCYTKHKNVAGYYLSFTQILGPWRGRGRKKSRTIVQRNFHGWETKQAAIEDCEFRSKDARKPPEQRTFIVPTLKDHFKPKRKRKPKPAPAPTTEAVAS
jgi:hypothetical protein